MQVIRCPWLEADLAVFLSFTCTSMFGPRHGSHGLPSGKERRLIVVSLEPIQTSTSGPEERRQHTQSGSKSIGAVKGKHPGIQAGWVAVRVSTQDFDKHSSRLNSGPLGLS